MVHVSYTTRTAHLHQGRFKAVPVWTDAHLLAVCRYGERNALGAGLIQQPSGQAIARNGLPSLTRSPSMGIADSAPMSVS
jgi:hypothetical protein